MLREGESLKLRATGRDELLLVRNFQPRNVTVSTLLLRFCSDVAPTELPPNSDTDSDKDFVPTELADDAPTKPHPCDRPAPEKELEARRCFANSKSCHPSPILAPVTARFHDDDDRARRNTLAAVGNR